MFPGLSLVQFLVQLPMIIVLIVGFGVLSARRRRLPRRAVTLGHAGCGVLLVATVFSGGWAAVLPRLLLDVDLTSSVWGVLTFVVGMVQAVLYAGGIGLLLGALLARTGPAGPPAAAGPPAMAEPAGPPAATEPTGPPAGAPPMSAAPWNAPPAAVWNNPPPGGGWNAAPPAGSPVPPPTTERPGGPPPPEADPPPPR
ncbi:MAG TPA: hypothetical protein VF755_20010 [Catenuloplanes sp.]|jgi:hypothetical protein